MSINKNRNQIKRRHKRKTHNTRDANRAQRFKVIYHQPALAPRLCTIYELDCRRRASLHVRALATHYNYSMCISNTLKKRAKKSLTM